MDTALLTNIGLVLLFVLVGGVFAATEMAIVSLRPSQVDDIERGGAAGRGSRGWCATPTPSSPPCRWE